MRTVGQVEQELAGGAVAPISSAMDVGQYAADLRRYARRHVRDEALVEDVVQDALVAALICLPRFRGNSSLKTWLFAILVHKIKDAFRREARYVRLPASGAEDAPMVAENPLGIRADALVSDRDPLSEMSWNRFSVCVLEAVERLPASLRQVFLLQAIEGLSTEDVCLRLGITESNCWVRLHRARKRLSVELADHY